jgi:hypothetical protein
VSAVNDYDPRNYRVIFMKILSALLALTFAVQVVVALATGHVTLMRTGRREVFREKSPAFFWVNVGVSTCCAVVLIYACFKRRRDAGT